MMEKGTLFNHSTFFTNLFSFFDEPKYKDFAVKFLKEYYVDINHARKRIDFGTWTYRLSTNFPAQLSGTECAPILLRAAMDFAYVDEKDRFKWTEADTAYLRKWFCSIIMQWKKGEQVALKQMTSFLKSMAKNKPIKPTIISPVESSKPEEQSKKVSSPIKSQTSMAHILGAFDTSTCNKKILTKLLQLPLIDLLRMSILSRILISVSEGQRQTDYQTHINWMLDNIDNWPNCILQQIPTLKQSYFTLVLQSDFCFPTGNIRMDLGMGLLCWTTKCCKAHCMLTLMDELMQEQLQWKQSSNEEKQRYLALKVSRNICIKKDGVFKFEKVRNHCTRAWQAVYGVHSGRINSATSPKKPCQEKSEAWRQSVKQLSNEQTAELDQHIEKTLLPNPFAAKGVKGNKYVLPPHLTSIHQLYWDYVWNHISSCKQFESNQKQNNNSITVDKLKRKIRADSHTVEHKRIKYNTSSKGFKSQQNFDHSGLYRFLETASDLHKQFCNCVVHYSSWYKHFNKKWNDEVVTGAFAKTWCQMCQNYIDESTKWHKFKNNQTEKSAKSQKYFAEKERWKKIKQEWAAHYEHATQERKSHELLRQLAADGNLRLICFDFKTTLVSPYWGYHCSPNQVHYLSRMNAYFFGIVDEGLPDHFTGYIYPENFVDSEGPAATKKGSSHVIAMLYDFMDNNGLTDKNRETDRLLHFAADNCSGQNKNQHVLKFFCSCIDLGWADDIKLDFMIPGHTKFGPDRWFGKIGKEIIKLDAWNIEQLIENVKKSVSYRETIKDFRNCNAKNFKKFLDSNYTKPKGLKVSENYHFWFSKDHPGSVRVRVKSDDAWSEPILLRKHQQTVSFPEQLPSFVTTPLSSQRINVMRQIKKTIAHLPEIKLDYEDKWDEWDFSSRVFEVREILKCRQVNGSIQYKVKFKDDKYNNWSDDKYDEWLTEDQLEDAQHKLDDFKRTHKEQPKASTVLHIRGYDHAKQTALVQWQHYPKENDWTWENISDLSDKDKQLLQPFINEYNNM